MFAKKLRNGAIKDVSRQDIKSRPPEGCGCQYRDGEAVKGQI